MSESDFDTFRYPRFEITPETCKFFRELQNTNLTTITFDDLNHLMLNVLRNFNVNSSAQWFNLDGRKYIQHVVVFSIHNISPTYVFSHLDKFKTIDTNFGTYIPYRYIEEDVTLLEQLVTVNIDPTKKKEKRQRDISTMALLLKSTALEKGKYPLLEDNYIQTKNKYSPIKPKSPLYALDCEMCQTERGSELTRISLIDNAFDVKYDSLVKPPKPITDYRTQYSGITAELLEPINKTLAEVQFDLRNILEPDAILCGHSLNFDLHALRMIHPYLIDTCLLFGRNGITNRKPKLKDLANQHLQMKIQDDASGHDSIEDCIAALKLVQMKLAQKKRNPKMGRANSVANVKFFSQNFLRVLEYTKSTAIQYFGPEIEGGYPSWIKTYYTMNNAKTLKRVKRNMLSKKYSFIEYELYEQDEENYVALEYFMSELFELCHNTTLILCLIPGSKRSNGIFFGKMKGQV